MHRVLDLLNHNPVVAILGARQVGKTTLAVEIADRYDGSRHRFDLENPDDLARLQEPMLALRPLSGLIVLDEIQRRPELFPVLRVLVDSRDHDARFLILGSASPDLIRQSSESLAGRIIYHELTGFDLDEVGRDKADLLWLQGGFPRSFLAPDTSVSFAWRRAFIQTFLERDIPNLGISIPPVTLHRFWQMLAHYHGQIWNGAEIARAFGISAPTVRRYLDILTGALVIRQVQPWFENISKRQVKAPKIYLADTGLLHTLLGIETRSDLQGHPKVGASWEGLVRQEIIRRLGARPEEVFFWATHAGAELDLLVIRGQRRLGFKIKRTTTPSRNRSQYSARSTLDLDSLDIVHAGDSTFPLGDDMRAVAFDRLSEDLEPL